MNNRVIIGYLTCKNRSFMFKNFINFINKILNKNKIFIYISLDSNSLDFFKKEALEIKDIEYDFTIVDTYDNIGSNYMGKIHKFVEYAKNNNFKYLMKLDNDILINNYIIDYMINNLNLLDNNDNLLLTPCLSSGIPTTEMFIEDFFNDNEKSILYEKFKNTNFDYLWGFDYSNLKQNNLIKWDSNKFYKDVKSTGYHYMGIHPIRINTECILYLNSIILNKKDELFKKQDYYMFKDNNQKYPYLCNSVFIMKTEIYNKIINDSSLYVDPFDEVPVNKYRQKYNLNFIFIRNSFTIHPFYNTILNHLEHEKNFIKDFFS